MSPAEQVAYWQHQARRHEQRVRDMGDYEQLKATAAEHERMVESNRTEHEKAIAEARRQGRAEALDESGGRLVEAYVRAAAAGRLEDERVNTLLQHLDRKAFLMPDGAVDTDKVYGFIGALAPPSPPAPANTPASQQPANTPAAAGTNAGGATPPGRTGPDFGQGRPATAPPSGLEAGRAAARARLGIKQPQPQA